LLHFTPNASLEKSCSLDIQTKRVFYPKKGFFFIPFPLKNVVFMRPPEFIKGLNTFSNLSSRVSENYLLQIFSTIPHP